MTNFKLLITIYLHVWWHDGVSSGVAALGNKSNSSNGTQTSAAISKRAKSLEVHLSANERNRRLIPYATYYIAGGNGGANIDHSNSIGPTDAPAEDHKLQHAHKQPYRAEDEYNYDYQQDPNTEYSYVPVAYIPGGIGVGGRPINYNPDAHYYPNAYYQQPIATETPKQHTTIRPPHKYSTTTQAASALVGTNTPKKYPFAYIADFISQQQNVAPVNYYKYVVTPSAGVAATTRKPASIVAAYEPKKPASAPYYLQNAAPVVTTPQSEYLNFRYSLYKTQAAPQYDTTTPSTVEITSPKHYLVNGVNAPLVSSYPELAHYNYATTPYAVTYEYPETQHQYPVLSPHKSAKAIAALKAREPVTQQSTKTLMTIMKSQELPSYAASANPAVQPTRVHYVQKPYSSHAVANADFSIDDILAGGYNINKQLPERITADNIKQSIKTLSYILQVLQKADSISQYQKHPPLNFRSSILDSSLEEHNSVSPLQNVDVAYDPPSYDTEKDLYPPEKPFKDPDQNTPGRAGIDYPVYSVIPETSFSCKTQRYKGFFADPDTKCQVWHYCDLNGGQASFLCPNGTIFNQAALTCDWWFNVKCAATPQLYVLNERLYKYILPMRPSFPEDFSGPLVDQYLSEKFKELETKGKYKYPPANTTVVVTTTPENENALNITALNQYEIPSHLINENL